MRELSASRRASMVVLYVGFAIVIALGTYPANYSPAAHILLAAGLMVVLGTAAWMLGAVALFGTAEQPRQLAAAGLLLITPILLIALLTGYGRPDQATLAENYLRFVILSLSAIAIGIGMTVLKEALNAAGERFFSTVGHAAIMLASPLYLVWVSITLAYLAQQHEGGAVPPIFRTLGDISDLWLFFGGALTYFATTALVVAMFRINWLGPVTASVLAVLSILALLLLSIRGFAFPDPHEAFQHWYTTLGWAAGIPAVPWLLPSVLGVILLRRAGDHP